MTTDLETITIAQAARLLDGVLDLATRSRHP